MNERHTLDSDAQEMVDLLAERMPLPFHLMGVQGTRDFIASFPQPDEMTDVAEVRDVWTGENESRIRLRVVTPIREEGLPILLWIHGGGWTFGTVEGSEPLCRHLAKLSGCIVVSVEYRLAPEYPFPTPLQDCVEAFLWLRANAASLGGDPSRLAIGGDSAGGNLAVGVTRALMNSGDSLPLCQLLAYPALGWKGPLESRSLYADGPLMTWADVEWFTSLYAGEDGNALDELAFPSNSMSFEGFPQTLVILAEVDVLRDEGTSFADVLVSQGVKAAARVYPGVFHGFFTEVDFLSRAKEAVGDSAEFLSSVFSRT
jgi:acetyl esterase